MHTHWKTNRRPVASVAIALSSSSSILSKPNNEDSPEINICEILKEVNKTEKLVKRDEKGGAAIKALSHKKHTEWGHFLEKSFIEGLKAVGECL
jgi:hypothetical protein